HQPSGGIGGTATHIRIQAEQMLYIKRTLAERIAFHTGQTVEQIETDSHPDRWFTADEARDYRFVAEVGRAAAHVLTAGRVSCTPWRGGGGPHREHHHPAPGPGPPRRTRGNPAAAGAGPLCPAVVRGADVVRDQGNEPVQQALRGADHLPWRADRRRVGQ